MDVPVTRVVVRRVRGDRRDVVVVQDVGDRGGNGDERAVAVDAAFDAPFASCVLARLLDERFHSLARDELAIDERGDGVAPAVRPVEYLRGADGV